MRKILLLACGLASSCSGPEAIPRTSSLTHAFEAAGARYSIPTELLVAVAVEQTHLTAGPAVMPDHPADGDHADVPSMGLLGLRPTRTDDQVAIAARELGWDVAEIVSDPDPAVGIFAGAAVLRAIAEDLGLEPRSIEEWAPALARFSGLPDGADRRFVGDVLRDLRQGLRVRASTGDTIEILGREVPEPAGIGVHELAVAEYEEAAWSGASGENYTSGRGGNGVETVVIHTVQGSYNGCISWFANPASGASAHFVVQSSDGAVTQMVEEGDTAWHAGNWDYNQRSVGIEHEGYVDDPDRWYTDALYDGSARLTRYLVDKYGIPVDRDHIFGHNEVPDPNNPGQFGGAGHHTDPGGGWDWDYFMGLVEGAGGEPRPEWGAELSAKDHPAEMTSGERVVAWVDLQNTGRQTWGLESTFLVSTEATSWLHDAENWVTDHRASGPDHSTYSSGTTGRFTFMIMAPEVAVDTTITEHFAVEQDGIGRIGPTQDVVFEILVHPRDGGGPAPDPDPAGDPDPGADPDDPGADPMADPGPGDDGFRTYHGSSGCSAAGRSHDAGWALMGLLGAVAGLSRCRRARGVSRA